MRYLVSRPPAVGQCATLRAPRRRPQAGRPVPVKTAAATGKNKYYDSFS